MASLRAIEAVGTSKLHADAGARVVRVRVCLCVWVGAGRHVTLRAGEVLEVCGESGSGKTEVVMLAAVVGVLPRLYNGVSYGGNEGGVVLMDLDGKFDMHRFMQLLEARVTATHAVICRERRSVPPPPSPLLPTPPDPRPRYKRLPFPSCRVHK